MPVKTVLWFFRNRFIIVIHVWQNGTYWRKVVLFKLSKISLSYRASTKSNIKRITLKWRTIPSSLHFLYVKRPNFPIVMQYDTEIEPAHEILALFVLRKFILQTCMRSHPVRLDVWFLVWLVVYFHTSCVLTAKALARLRESAGSLEPSLITYVISPIISWAGSNVYCNVAWGKLGKFFFVEIFTPLNLAVGIILLCENDKTTQGVFKEV